MPNYGYPYLRAVQYSLNARLFDPGVHVFLFETHMPRSISYYYNDDNVHIFKIWQKFTIMFNYTESAEFIIYLALAEVAA